MKQISPLMSFVLATASLAVASLFLGCRASTSAGVENKDLRAQYCEPIAGGEPELTYEGQGAARFDFADIRDAFNSACQNCHQAPANMGGFTYIDNISSELRTIGGVTKEFLGFREVAETASEVLLTSDEMFKMPPKEKREKNPEAYLELGRRLQQWIKAGKPQGSFDIDASARPKTDVRVNRTEVGECFPKAEYIGSDYKKDREFKSMTKLPKNLSDTDIFTFDSLELGKRGTLSYNVAYPLWADNADKGRWIHLPSVIENGKLVRQAVRFNGDRTLEIPENTRFYKSFYKKFDLGEGRFRYRRVETRIIVVRKPSENTLFGTYKWDDQEQSAILVETPYRDGSGFKDHIFDIHIDAKGTKKKYAIPGSQRCFDCHRGSESQNMIIGFNPLQLNHRKAGAGGMTRVPTEADIGQVERLKRYGVIENAPPRDYWPQLEFSGSTAPRSSYELQAQGYMLGNCAHCHNPNGLAFKNEDPVSLDLRAGMIFGFNTKLRSVQIRSRLLVHQQGDLDQSHIYRKVSDGPEMQGFTSQMPMNTPGSPDCTVLRVMGKWVKSFESLEAAEAWEPKCEKKSDLSWIDLDFTTPKSDSYIPKRADWATAAGMPEKYKTLNFSAGLDSAIAKEYAVGYWNAKNECKFPNVQLDPLEVRPWMLRAGQPKRPFGEVYTTTPGSYFYRNSCGKCHGAQADGKTALSKGILLWSGGSVRVANFIDGMFGNSGKNLETFNVAGVNLASRYMIWMAMEGTQVKFPDALSSYLGKHGGQMLNMMREKCVNQVAPGKSNPNYMDHEIFNSVCFFDNRAAGDPDLAYDPQTDRPVYPDRVNEWADRAAYNIGYAIFQFLNEAGQGRWKPSVDQCEKVYPSP